MKPLLFEKLSSAKFNLEDLISNLNDLFNDYEVFASVWEGRKYLLRDALLPVVGKKKQSDLICLAQKFEEVHIVSLEQFLTEVSTRAVHIFTFISDFKTYSLTSDPGYNELCELCSNVEWIQQKVISRFKKNGLKERNNPLLKRERSKEKERGKVLSPKPDRKTILLN